MKKLNKKGFTLAELLIVVAIIAVLTAIAVPLFTGALSKANDSVKAANIRAVKSEAVSHILLAPTSNTEVYESGKTTLPNGWDIKATVDANGNITFTEFKPKTTGATYSATATESGGTWTVTLVLTAADISTGNIVPAGK